MKKALKIITNVIISIILAAIIINIAVLGYSSIYIKKPEKLEYNNVCILVPGTGVKGDKADAMLEDRLAMAVKLYDDARATYVIMSGNGITEGCRETEIMNQYALDKGLEQRIVIQDTAGLSIYESIYRLKNVLGAKKGIIVTQKCELYRAVFIARCFGIDAVGVNATNKDSNYENGLQRHFSEFFARIRDFFMVFIKPQPAHTDYSYIK